MSKKGQKYKRYSAEFKTTVILDMREHQMGYRETARKYELVRQSEASAAAMVQRWERIYLEEGAEGLMKERRGRTNNTSDGVRKGRPPKPKKGIEEDLIAENQRLCYFIGRLLPARLREKRLSKNIKGFSAFAIGLGVSMTFLGYSGPACLLLGALRLSLPALIWGCFIGMLSEVAACSLLCSPHSSFLPNNVLIIFRVAGVVLLCAALISAARKYSDI